MDTQPVHNDTPQTHETGAPGTPAPAQSKKPIVIAIIVAALLLGGAAGYIYYTKNQDEVLAVVNGTKVYKTEFDENVKLLVESAGAQGINPDDATVRAEIETQALDILINNILLIDAAQEAGIVVDDAKIAETKAALAAQAGGEEALITRMAEMGLTEETLRENITERILVDTYIESVSDIETLSVTDEEIQAFITANAPADAELPPLEEIRPVIEAELIRQKQQKIVEDLIASLREAATIERK